MAILTPANLWSNVYKLDTADPVKGGTVSGAVDAPTDGHANAPLQGLANRTQYLYNRLTPVGAMEMWPTTTAPTGWVICNGALLNAVAYPVLFSVIGYTFGGSGGFFRVPDARGRFPRGYSDASGLDPDAASRTAMNTGGNTGNNIGSVQDDAFEAHTHDVSQVVSSGSDGGSLLESGSATSQATSSTGGSETRPKNFYINFIIRADY